MMDAKKLASLFDNPNFAKWFGGSKVVDADGVPIVASHTTSTPWEAFDPSLAKESSVYGKGIYVSLEKPWKSNGNSVSMDLLVNSKNPLDLTSPMTPEAADLISKYLGRDINPDNGVPLVSLERKGGSVGEGAKAAGFDGIVHYGPGNTGRHIVVFEPTQIKSTDNVGTFDPNDPNIYRAALPFAAGAGLMSSMLPSDAEAVQRIREKDLPLEDAWNPLEAFAGGLGGGLKSAAMGVLPDGAMDWAINRIGGLMSGGK